jgi:hypothetical protein
MTRRFILVPASRGDWRRYAPLLHETLRSLHGRLQHIIGVGKGFDAEVEVCFRFAASSSSPYGTIVQSMRILSPGACLSRR